jgi:hypothetical protein
MSIVGTLLKNRRAGEAKLAWNLPVLARPETLRLSSAAFTDGAPIPWSGDAATANSKDDHPERVRGSPDSPPSSKRLPRQKDTAELR